MSAGVEARHASRRLLAVCAAAAIAAGLITLPQPPTAVAQGTVLTDPPIMYITPDCISYGGQQTLTVEGRNFEPGLRVQVNVYGSLNNSVFADASPYGHFTTTINVNVDDYYLSVHLEARILYPDLDDVPPPDADAYANGCGNDAMVIATPNCGDPANPSIRVHGERFPFYTNILIGLTQYDQVIGETMSIPAGGWDFDVTFRPGVTLEPGEYEVRATQNSPPYDVGFFQASGWDSFVVPCPQVNLSPTCARKPGSPPDQISIDVTGVSGWLRGTADGSDEIQVVFDPDGEAQEFFYHVPYGETGISEDGSFGPLTIEPFARPRDTYTIQVKQQQYSRDPDDPLLDQRLTFTVPCVRPVLRVDQTCGQPAILGDVPRNYSLNLTAINFPRGKAVAIFDPEGASGVTPTRLDFVIDQPGDYEVPFDVPYRQPGRYRIEVTVDTGENLYSASTLFDVPCAPPKPTLELEPACVTPQAGTPGAYQLAVTGAGFAPGPVELVFDPNGTPESGQPAAADDSGILNGTFVANGRSPGSYEMLARQSTEAGVYGEVKQTLTVGCDVPVLTITPSSGPRGFVAQVTGSGFKAGVVLALTWDLGINAARPTNVTTGPNGDFSRQLLIFQHDFLGVRHLSVTQPADPLAALPPAVDYLVTAGTTTPPRFDVSNTVDAPDAIVLRR